MFLMNRKFVKKKTSQNTFALKPHVLKTMHTYYSSEKQDKSFINFDPRAITDTDEF